MFTFWGQHWLRHSTSLADDHLNLAPFEELIKISAKNSSGTVTLCYHVDLAIDIPNITENYINSHFSLVIIGNLGITNAYLRNKSVSAVNS